MRTTISLFLPSLLFCLSLISCDKVTELSDDAYVESFTILSYTPLSAELGDVKIVKDSIQIVAMPNKDIFPLTLRAKVKGNSSSTDILGLPDELIFNYEESFFDFHVIAASGTPHRYRISIIPASTGADITDFHVPEHKHDAIIDQWNNEIILSINSYISFPYTITPTISLSPDATIKDPELTYTFENIDDVQKITVISADGTISRDWSIRFDGLVQLPNSEFEYWINLTSGVINIDPYPEKGKGWATANNSYVKGTKPIDYNGGKAASLTTGTQTVPLLNHHLITAGTLYLGYFSLSLDFENPRSMTNFGIPHTVYIKGVEFDLQYIAGEQLQQSVKDPDAKNKYRIKDIDGYDQGQVWVEMLHWESTQELKYNGNPINGLTVLGRKELVIDGADTSYHDWQRIRLDLDYTNTTLNPTHIALVFSSSKEGDKFKGAPGSQMNVDNVELIYE